MISSTFNFKGVHQAELFGYKWGAENPKARIYLMHGYGEHAGRYSVEAEVFIKAGYEVISYDHRGHGKSSGTKGYVTRFDRYTDDLAIFLKENWDDQIPSYLYGHSVGALITVDFLLKTKFKKKNLQGVLTTGAAFILNKDLAPFLQKISGLLSAVVPKLRTLGIDNKLISRDREVIDAYQNDPLILHKGTHARSGAELIKKMKLLKNQYAEFNYPCLIMHGKEDRLIDPDGSEYFYAHINSSDKELVMWEESYHEIIRDLDKDRVLAKMISWMDDRLS